MADVASNKGKDKATKPEKPDEEAFKNDLAAAEKAHEAAKARLVFVPFYRCIGRVSRVYAGCR